MLTFLFLAFSSLVATVGARENAPSQASSTFVECHAALDSALAQPAKAFADDVHSRHGYTCADWHGGDPDAEDPAVAMGPAKGFIGVPDPAEVSKLSGRHHANAALMCAEKPGLRADQLELYCTSRHGMLLKKGDTNVAVYSGCHQAHGVLPPSDPGSSVHLTREVARSSDEMLGIEEDAVCASCSTERNAGFRVAFLAVGLVVVIGPVLTIRSSER